MYIESLKLNKLQDQQIKNKDLIKTFLKNPYNLN